MRQLANSAGDGSEHLAQRASVGPRRDGPVLRSAQTRGGDHLHRLGDLLRVLDRTQPPSDVDEGSHRSNSNFEIRISKLGHAATALAFSLMKRSLNSLIAAARDSSVAFSSLPVLRIAERISDFSLLMNWWRPLSKSGTASTRSESKWP